MQKVGRGKDTQLWETRARFRRAFVRNEKPMNDFWQEMNGQICKGRGQPKVQYNGAEGSGEPDETLIKGERLCQVVHIILG